MSRSRGAASGVKAREDRFREYVTETYKTEDRKILSLIKRHLSNPGLRDPDWQVTVVRGKEGVILTERPGALETLFVLGLRGEKFLFRKIRQG